MARDADGTRIGFTRLIRTRPLDLLEERRASSQAEHRPTLFEGKERRVLNGCLREVTLGESAGRACPVACRDEAPKRSPPNLAMR
jgi:hypothetical protein